ncbi:MAG TPA: tRNA (adenosine(37)-N6)-threonylcarbamoyltransferase complex ATPase subunit type 1 TsaE [Burkholderiales bacterium]|nr:tRNA (adenosine(37)-N6)-threonylcarbamoyltransferase complex ATPase subunit type 1 TsaE [Burkholderiales bacterium]
MLAPVVLPLEDEKGTHALGARLAGALRAGVHVQLEGELGTGKTTLVRACLRALGYRERVKSPTYTLVEPYELSKLCLYHFDFYRLHEPQEWLEAGFRDYFNDASVCLVEWPEKAGATLPPADLRIRLEYANKGRRATLIAVSPMGLAMLQSISSGAD